MKKYQKVTARLEQDLGDISFENLDISDEVKEQVKVLFFYIPDQNRPQKPKKSHRLPPRSDYCGFILGGTCSCSVQKS